MIKKILKWIGIIFIGLVVIGMLFGEEETAQVSNDTHKTLAKIRHNKNKTVAQQKPIEKNLNMKLQI